MYAVVDAHRRAEVDRHRGDRPGGARAGIRHRERDQVGQVVLAVPVARQLRQARGQPVAAEAVDAAVDFLRAGLLTDRVARLGDADDAPPLVARDPPVLAAVRVDADRQRRHRAARDVLGEGAGDHLDGVERVVGEEDHHVVDRGVEGGHRDHDRVAGAELLRLHHHLDVVAARPEVPAQLVRLVADDHDHLRRAAAGGGVEHRVDHRAARDGVEQLGEAGSRARMVGR